MVLSILIVLGELTIMLQFEFSLFEELDKIMGIIGANILSFSILLYLSLCTYYGFFHLKFSTFYGIYPHNQTDSYSLLLSANFFSKLAPPLCLNFCELFNIHDLAFHKMLNAMNPIPILGEDF